MNLAGRNRQASGEQRGPTVEYMDVIKELEKWVKSKPTTHAKVKWMLMADLRKDIAQEMKDHNKFQTSGFDVTAIDDSYEFYPWWQKPLYWWRVIVQKMRKKGSK